MDPKVLSKIGSKNHKIFKKSLYIKCSFSSIYYRKIGLSYIDVWLKIPNATIYYRPAKDEPSHLYIGENLTVAIPEHEYKIYVSGIDHWPEEASKSLWISDSIIEVLKVDFDHRLATFYDSFDLKMYTKYINIDSLKLKLKPHSQAIYTPNEDPKWIEFLDILSTNHLDIRSLKFNDLYEMQLNKEHSALAIEAILYKTKIEELWDCIQNYHEYAIELMQQIHNNSKIFLDYNPINFGSNQFLFHPYFSIEISK